MKTTLIVALLMVASVSAGEFHFYAYPTNTYIVQSSDTVTGPWTDLRTLAPVKVAGDYYFTYGYHPDMSKRAKFYRLKTVIPPAPKVATNSVSKSK